MRFRIVRLHIATNTKHHNFLTFTNKEEMYKTLHDWNARRDGWLYYWEP